MIAGRRRRNARYQLSSSYMVVRLAVRWHTKYSQIRLLHPLGRLRHAEMINARTNDGERLIAFIRNKLVL